jgi:hypothetical protein
LCSPLCRTLQALFPAPEPYIPPALAWLEDAAVRGLTAFLVAVSFAMLAVLVRNVQLISEDGINPWQDLFGTVLNTISKGLASGSDPCSSLIVTYLSRTGTKLI